MSNESKICPFMSRPAQDHITESPFNPELKHFASELIEVPCLGERCAAWRQFGCTPDGIVFEECVRLDHE